MRVNGFTILPKTHNYALGAGVRLQSGNTEVEQEPEPAAGETLSISKRTISSMDSFVRVFAHESQHLAASRPTPLENEKKIVSQDVSILPGISVENKKLYAISGKAETITLDTEEPGPGASTPGDVETETGHIYVSSYRQMLFAGLSRFVDIEMGHGPQIMFFDGLASAIKVQQNMNSINQLETTKGVTFQPARMEMIINNNLDLFTQQSKIYDRLREKLNNLLENVNNLTSEKTYTFTRATSSSASAATAEALKQMEEADYEITVNRTATAQQVMSDQLNKNRDTAMGLSGTFVLNGETITLEATDTLIDLAEKINYGEDINFNGVLDPSEDTNTNGLLDSGEDLNNNGILDPTEDVNSNGQMDGGTANHRVKAIILNEKLILTALDTNREMQFSDPDDILKSLGIIELNAADQVLEVKNELVAAAPAVFSVDGTEYTRDTNTVSDAIDGLELTLISESTDAATISVGGDTETVHDAITSFIEVYNEAMTFMNDQLKQDGLMRNEVRFGQIRTRIDRSLTDPVNISNSNSVHYQGLTTLADIGSIGINEVDTSTYGTNEAALNSLLRIMARELSQEIDYTTGKTKRTVSGTLNARNVDGIPSIINSLDQLGIVSRDQGTLELDESRLEEVLEGNPEIVKAVMIQSANGNEGAAIRLESNLESLLKPISGGLSIYQDTIDKKIAMMEQQQRMHRAQSQIEQLYSQKQLISSLILTA